MVFVNSHFEYPSGYSFFFYYEKLDYCLQLRQLGIDTELAIQMAFNKKRVD